MLDLRLKLFLDRSAYDDSSRPSECRVGSYQPSDLKATMANKEALDKNYTDERARMAAARKDKVPSQS